MEETNKQNENTIDIVEASTRKDFVLERLNKRNKDRQNYLDVKLEQRSKETQQNEGVDFFAQSFGQRAYDLEQRISTMQLESGDAPLPDLSKHFADITIEIQELQRYLTSSTMFLSDFKIKSCQNMLNALTSACDEARQRLMPKKKFGFSGKKLAVKQKQPVAVSKVDGPEKKTTNSSAFTWTIANKRSAHIVLRGEEVNGLDITISNVHKCLIELQGHPGSVQISNASQCTLLCGPVARSLFAEQLERCTIAIACQQLRLHSSQATRIYLHVTCRAIIEDCRQIEIDVYNYDYAELEADYATSGLNKSQNNYTDVADFNWLSPDVPSPNWTLLKDHAAPNWSAVRRDFKSSCASSADNIKDNSII
ncbi:tubulin-specific chaperone C [Drosophila innubila]|uniref:tubulin-specific chaperone C n=1 Tax=Drosophila innubila TaxID=198719 RepID=UPI00148C15DC|nr:tubulin-specific chaperone C [Drosophila innubila]XP_034475214.1 tubulin-specific chaperone C [Drosophila innubila]XP_034475215.1 tubulin-specific chaperone C [Drosophila innubila]XP_034475216.1 tubulin-specific chaperone C [Drosophila innubila]